MTMTLTNRANERNDELAQALPSAADFGAKLKHNLCVEPYPYQKDGIRFGLERRRILIGDEPGLGKTLQSIGIVDTAMAYPCLVICPSSLKINWQREFEKFTDKKALVLDNATRTSWPYLLGMGMFHVAIVNYESLKKFFVWDIKGGSSSKGRFDSSKNTFTLKDVVFNRDINIFRSVIMDESHRLKDPSAQQTMFTRGIVEGKEWRILLSGTPVVNHAQDLVAQLAIMGRLLSDFGGRGKFLADYGENENLSELSDKLYDCCMIRREKKSVLTQLPDKQRTDLHVDISNRDEYNLAAADLAAYLREYTECTDREIRRKMRMEALVKFMTLRSLASKGKVKQATDFIRNFLANGKPLIVFCSLKEIVKALQKQFPDAVRVTGDDSLAEKTSRCRRLSVRRGSTDNLFHQGRGCRSDAHSLLQRGVCRVPVDLCRLLPM